MSYSIRVVPRSTSATAFQLVQGETTATQLREFSDHISVGHYERDERDLVWVHVHGRSGEQEARYGDWIVKDDLGHLTVLGERAFIEAYTPADDNARATLSARDMNDLRVRTAHQLAKSFAQSLSRE